MFSSLLDLALLRKLGVTDHNLTSHHGAQMVYPSCIDLDFHTPA